MWALLAVTPGVAVNRIDVGGNRAGTQAGYTAYGFTGQVRVLIEGINTTEGTGGAGFYFDYASLEEAFLGTTGQTAEMPNPGVQSQFIAKSGGNRFAGRVPPRLVQQLAAGHEPARRVHRAERVQGHQRQQRDSAGRSNEIHGYYDHDINVGGPIKKDKVWWFRHLPRAAEQGGAAELPVRQDVRHQAVERRRQGHLSAQSEEQADRLLPVGPEDAAQPAAVRRPTPTRRPSRRSSRTPAAGSTRASGTARSATSCIVEARYGDFGYYFPLVTNSPDNFFWHDTGALVSEGAHQAQQLDRDRKQWTAAATYFLDTGAGSHTLKMGGELLKEQSWEGFTSRRGGTSNIEQMYANGVSTQVIFGIPTARERQQLERAQRSAVARRARTRRLVRQRHMGGRPLDDQPRRALRPLPRLAARTGAARRDGRAASPSPARRSPQNDLYTSNLVGAAPRLRLRPGRQRQDRDQGELRVLLAQPRRRASRRTPTRTSPASRHLQLERSGGVRRLHRRRQAVAAGRTSRDADRTALEARSG